MWFRWINWKTKHAFKVWIFNIQKIVQTSKTLLIVGSCAINCCHEDYRRAKLVSKRSREDIMTWSLQCGRFYNYYRFAVLNWGIARVGKNWFNYVPDPIQDISWEKKTAQKDTTKDITIDSHMNSFFPYSRSPASPTFTKKIVWLTNVQDVMQDLSWEKGQHKKTPS